MSESLIWIAILSYLVVALVIAVLSRQRGVTDMSGYFLGNRQMNGFVSALSYSATTYSAFMMVGLAGLTYAGGVGALGFEIIYFARVSVVAVFGPRFWAVGKRYGYVTPSEMLGHRYASNMVAVVAWVAQNDQDSHGITFLGTWVDLRRAYYTCPWVMQRIFSASATGRSGGEVLHLP